MRRTSVFAEGENLGAGAALPPRAFQSRMGTPAGPGPLGDGRQGPLRASDSSGGAVQVIRTHKGPGHLPGARSIVRPLQGPHRRWGGALRRPSVFAEGENLGAGTALPPRAFQSRMGTPAGPGPLGDGRQGPLRASDSSGGAVQVIRTHKGPGHLPGARSFCKKFLEPTGSRNFLSVTK